MPADSDAVPYPPELTERDVGDEDRQLTRWVGDRAPSTEAIVIVDPDPCWAAEYESAATVIRAALDVAIVRIEHVGSTSVPGLPAKPIIDIDVQLPDSSDEAAYVPALEAAGYRHLLREPWWNGHRMLVRDRVAVNGDGDGTGRPAVNLHIFPAGAPEPLRHLLFRDWLRTHEDDRELYAAAKRRLALETAENPDSYNLDKNAVIDDIYTRIFNAPPESHPAWPAEGWKAGEWQSTR